MSFSTVIYFKLEDLVIYFTVVGITVDLTYQAELMIIFSKSTVTFIIDLTVE